MLFGFCGECQRRSTLAVWEAVMQVQRRPELAGGCWPGHLTAFTVGCLPWVTARPLCLRPVQVFDALPLAALLNNKVFLCHGGISPYLHRPQDVNAIRRPLVSWGRAGIPHGSATSHVPLASRVRRARQLLNGCHRAALHGCSRPLRSHFLLLAPPLGPQDVNPNGEGLLADLLWADPSGHISGWCANPRGVSFVFGLDVAQQWLRKQVGHGHRGSAAHCLPLRVQPAGILLLCKPNVPR